MPYKDRDKHAEAQKEYSRNWYQRHKDKVIERKKQRQQDIHNWFRRYKSTLYCMDCGISHPAVLQFHHLSRADKSFTISSIVSRATSVKQITNEIKKCDVLCVNCHAKRHWRETYGSDSWEELLQSEEE
jgi:hypothetical protein